MGQKGTVRRVWAARGSRPRAPRALGFKWTYVFGAVCPGRGAAAGLVLPVANAEAMALHLAAISGQVAPGADAVVVLDGAGYHQAKALAGRVPTNLSLLPLPPYSPELNPMELVWQDLRRRDLANRQRAEEAGVREHDGFGGEREHVIHRPRRGVSQVDEHAQPLHLTDDIAA